MRQILTALSIFCVASVFAQSKMLSEEEFLAVLKKYHPVVRQAALELRIADAEITESRGAFDPVLSYTSGRKEFDGINYYDRSGAELKVPTWYGIDIYAGTQGAGGRYLNPEETRGEMTYLGVSVPVVQNLLIDRRRAILQQAKIYREQAEFIRRSILNNLVLDGLYSYWEWWEQYHTYRLIGTAMENAQKRFAMVKTAYQLGDRPAIDTLEAFTQIQYFSLEQSQALADLLKSQYELSTFLWTENESGYQLPAEVAPQPWSNGRSFLLDSLLTAANNHPDLVQYNFKLNALEIERRLKFQQFLPDVDLKYQQLGKGYDLGKPVNNAWFENNYRFGVSVSVPLRLSAGRGGYQKARFKLEQTRLEQLNKRVVIENKIKQYFVEWQQVQQQINVQVSMVNNFAALQRGEETRFFNGESSLFIINARELKTLESQIKLVQLQAKNKKAAVSLQWASGLGAF
jgi:outer membrane protein TolC